MQRDLVGVGEAFASTAVSALPPPLSMSCARGGGGAAAAAANTRLQNCAVGPTRARALPLQLQLCDRTCIGLHCIVRIPTDTPTIHHKPFYLAHLHRLSVLEKSSLFSAV